MRNFLLFILLFICTSTYGQEDPDVTKRLKEKYGFASYHNTDGGWYSIVKGEYDFNHKSGNEGACDINGREIIPPIYDNVNFNQTYYKVEKNGLVGIRDLNNKELLPCNRYTDVQWYQKEKNNGFCEVKFEGKWGIIDKNNKEIVPCRYDNTSLYQFKEGDFCEVKLNGKAGVVNKNGEEIIPCRYDKISSHQFKEGDFCEVKLNGKEGVVNKKGEEIIHCQYDEVRAYQFKDQDYCEVLLNDKLGVVNKNGEEIAHCLFDYICLWQFKDGDFCEVISNGKQGVINKQGKVILPCGMYDYISFLPKHNTIAVSKGAVLNFNEYGTVEEITKNGKWGMFDLAKGKEIIACKYDYIATEAEDLLAFNVNGKMVDGKKKTTEGGKWGFLDTTGKEIIPAQYDAASSFKDGVAQVKKDGVTSVLTHPLKGTTLKVAQGNSIAVDTNIPQTNKVNENVFAFIIANENYAHMSGADYSINDGKVFAEYCKKTLGIPEKNVRYFEDATYGNIINAIKKMQDIADVYEGDASIIFYYSGLGATDSKSTERYLLATDASFEALQSTGYSVAELLKSLNTMKTEYTWVILDAPFSNVDKTGKNLADARSAAIKPKAATPQGNVIVSMASNGVQAAYSSQQYGHSLFTYGMLEKIQQTKGNCTLKDVSDYATQWVKKTSLQTFDKVQESTTNVSETLINKWNNIKL